VLSTEFDARCRKLNTAYEKYEKNRKKAVISGLVVIGIALAVIVLIPEGQTFDQKPEISYPGAIGLLITVIITGFFQRKSSRYKKIGYEKYLVKFYRAYLHLQNYQKNDDQEQLDATYNELDNVISDLKLEIGDLTQTKPIFKSFQTPLSNFISYLDLRLIPVLDTDEKVDVTKIEKSLEKILEFFDNDDFTQIYSVNEDLFNNYEEISEEEKSFLETIREHRTLTRILISILIIAVSGGISYGAALSVKADNITFVGWWIVISTAFTAAYLWKSK